MYLYLIFQILYYKKAHLASANSCRTDFRIPTFSMEPRNIQKLNRSEMFVRIGYIKIVKYDTIRCTGVPEF